MIPKTKFRLPHADETRSTSERERTTQLKAARKFKQQMRTN